VAHLTNRFKIMTGLKKSPDQYEQCSWRCVNYATYFENSVTLILSEVTTFIKYFDIFHILQIEFT